MCFIWSSRRYGRFVKYGSHRYEPQIAIEKRVTCKLADRQFDKMMKKIHHRFQNWRIYLYGEFAPHRPNNLLLGNLGVPKTLFINLNEILIGIMNWWGSVQVSSQSIFCLFSIHCIDIDLFSIKVGYRQWQTSMAVFVCVCVKMYSMHFSSVTWWAHFNYRNKQFLMLSIKTQKM